MKVIVKIGLFIVALLALIGGVAAQKVDSTYSFFIAGHSYGTPGVDNAGLHPPFEAKFPYIQSRQEIGFGILLGDIVRPSPIEQDWVDVDNSVESLGLPVYFAVGNHDMENREVFESRYGSTYYAFDVSDDLFIVLDPNLDGWNISGDQMTFLDSLLSNHANEYENIFVAFHQLLWWESDNKYAPVYPNSLAGRAEVVNFWTEVEPLFHQLQNKVFMMAGDLGAASWSSDVLYDTYDNITFVATGMGENDGDNFIVINEYDNDIVSFDLVCLTDVLDCMGSLESHDVDLLTIDSTRDFDVEVYPTTLKKGDHILIENNNIFPLHIEVYNTLGELVAKLECEEEINEFNTNELSRGVFMIFVSSKGGVIEVFKVLVF